MQAILECKQCGAQLEVTENQKIVKCKFCGSANAVSFADRFGLYNRANYLRRQNEFDRAISVYEDILKEDEHDAEAYYGIALCKYGIEYVDDPNGNGKIPTCHRTKYTPISQDVDFKKAVENTDAETALIYNEEAKKIDEILKKIQALSNNQEKYDIFICYKEGDGMGGRTQTSVYAQEVYQELTKQGYKVFFARKTLEKKLGSDYEPIIFAALFSAKVMLVVGTKPEEFQGVWVRNEWTRYRERMANGEECTLIPLYCDMSPYELPQEFVNIQALDMKKIGFMQDLSDGLKKIIRRESVFYAQNISQNIAGEVSSTNLKKRARLALEQGDFSSAASYVERALDKNPEDAESYIMCVQISRKCVKEEALGEGLESLESDNDYQLAIRFANEEELQRYKYYETLIQQRLFEIAQEEEATRIRKEKEKEEYRKKQEEKKRARQQLFKKKLEKWKKRRKKIAVAVISMFIIIFIWMSTASGEDFVRSPTNKRTMTTDSYDMCFKLNHTVGSNNHFYIKLGKRYYVFMLCSDFNSWMDGRAGVYEEIEIEQCKYLIIKKDQEGNELYIKDGLDKYNEDIWVDKELVSKTKQIKFYYRDVDENGNNIFYDIYGTNSEGYNYLLNIRNEILHQFYR